MSSVSNKGEKSKGTGADTRAEPKSERVLRAAGRVKTESSEELAALRKLASLAVRIFEADGIMGDLTPVQVIGEALRCNLCELRMFADAVFGGRGEFETMHFKRAMNRIELALALASYGEKFGPIKISWDADDESPESEVANG